MPRNYFFWRLNEILIHLSLNLCLWPYFSEFKLGLKETDTFVHVLQWQWRDIYGESAGGRALYLSNYLKPWIFIGVSKQLITTGARQAAQIFTFYRLLTVHSRWHREVYWNFLLKALTAGLLFVWRMMPINSWDGVMFRHPWPSRGLKHEGVLIRWPAEKLGENDQSFKWKILTKVTPAKHSTVS